MIVLPLGSVDPSRPLLIGYEVANPVAEGVRVGVERGLQDFATVGEDLDHVVGHHIGDRIQVGATHHAIAQCVSEQGDREGNA